MIFQRIRNDHLQYIQKPYDDGRFVNEIRPAGVFVIYIIRNVVMARRVFVCMRARTRVCDVRCVNVCPCACTRSRLFGCRYVRIIRCVMVVCIRVYVHSYVYQTTKNKHAARPYGKAITRRTIIIVIIIARSYYALSARVLTFMGRASADLETEVIPTGVVVHHRIGF